MVLKLGWACALLSLLVYIQYTVASKLAIASWVSTTGKTTSCTCTKQLFINLSERLFSCKLLHFPIWLLIFQCGINTCIGVSRCHFDSRYMMYLNWILLNSCSLPTQMLCSGSRIDLWIQYALNIKVVSQVQSGTVPVCVHLLANTQDHSPIQYNWDV